MTALHTTINDITMGRIRQLQDAGYGTQRSVIEEAVSRLYAQTQEVGEMAERLTQRQSDIVDRTGAESWERVVEWYGGMTRDEIAASVEDIWPGDPSNDELIEMLVEEMP